MLVACRSARYRPDQRVGVDWRVAGHTSAKRFDLHHEQGGHASLSAAALARYLLHEIGGADRIREMILDDIHNATERGSSDHVTDLSQTLGHFLERHLRRDSR